MNIKIIYKKIFEFLFVSFFFILFCGFLNKNINIKSLYMDDLENFYYYLRQNIFEYSFVTLENQVHFRPIFYFTLYIYFKIITGHIKRAVLINIIVNSLLGIEIYYILKKLNINKFLSYILIILFFVSHFSYFQLGQCICLIGTESMFFALLIFLYSVLYIKQNKNKYFYLSIICLFLISFIHERYIVLAFPIFLISFFNYKNNKNTKLFFILLFFVVFSVFLIRYFKLNSIVPVGTDKTIIYDNFDIKRSIKFFIEQVLYIFGFNMGPEYLSGINFFNLDYRTKILIYIQFFLILTIFSLYFFVKINNFFKNKEKISVFYIDLIFILFILFCILSSSITIRLEMRWIYISYVFFLIYIFYIVNTIYKNHKFLLFFLASFFLLRLSIDINYRSYYKNIFFYNDLIATNSLAEETIYKYGEGVLNSKKIYITNFYFKLSGRWYRHFFEPFTGKKNEDVVLNEVENIEEIFELSKNKNNIVLVENVENKTYIPFVYEE